MHYIALPLLLILSTAVQAIENYGHATVSDVIKVCDGNTIVVNINGWPDVIGKKITVRVKGIVTPRIKSSCQTEKILAQNVITTVASLITSASSIKLRNIQRSSCHFKLLADVFIDDIDLAFHLLSLKLAKPYSKDRKKRWNNLHEGD